MLRGQDLHRGGFVGDAIRGEPAEGPRVGRRSPDRPRVRAVLRLVELELVVLDDDGAALGGVVQQPLVVGAEVVAPLVRAHAGHHHRESRQVRRRELVGRQELHGGAQLHQGGRHLVADAHDVADGHTGHRLQVEDLQAAGRVGHEVTPTDVRVLDGLVPLVERLPVARGHGLHVVASRPGTRGRGDGERHLARLVFTRERDRLGRRRRRPAGRQLQRDVGRPTRAGVVGHRDADVARHSATGEGDDIGAQLDRERGDDQQFLPLLAAEDVAFVAERHRIRHHLIETADRQRHLRGERRRLERQAEGRLRIEVVVVAIGQPLPVRRRQLGLGGHGERGVADVRLETFERDRRAGGRPFEPGELHGLHRHAVATAGKGAQRDLRRLSAHDQAVIGQQVDAEPRGQSQRFLGLPLLLLETEVDFVARVGIRVHVAELRAERTHRRQHLRQRGAGAGDALGLEGELGAAHLAFERLDGEAERGRSALAEARETAQAGVDAGEHVRVLLRLRGREDRVLEHVHAGLRPGQAVELGHALAHVHAARLGAEFVVGAAEQRVEDVAVDAADGLGRGLVRTATKPARVVELRRLPRLEPGGDLGRELRGIGREAEGLGRDVGRGLVVLPAALRVIPDEADDHVGADLADPVDVVLEDLVAVPPREGLVTAEREAEVHGAREVLLGAVDAVRGVEFLGAQHGQGLEDLRANLVLAPVAAGRGDQRGPHPVAELVAGQQRIVLVVGMRRGHHQATDRPELPEHEAERRLVGVLADGLEAVLGVRRHGEREQQRDASDACEGAKSRSGHVVHEEREGAWFDRG